jgi:hypothetical protein
MTDSGVVQAVAGHVGQVLLDGIIEHLSGATPV